MKDYTRGVWDALVYVLGLLETRGTPAVVLELMEIKDRIEREASRDFEARIKTL